MADKLVSAPFEQRDIDLLEPISQRRSYKAGATIFQEGDPAGPLCVLVKGLVSFRQRPSDKGEGVTMGTASHEGEVFGISALIGDGDRYVYSGVCLEDTELIEVDRDRLLALCEAQPEAGVRILRTLLQVLAARFAGAREQLRSRVQPGLISHG